jgi:hypothetical protein
MRKRGIVLLACWMVLSAGILVAQRMAVPVNLQVAIFKKILAFDKTLQSKGRIEVAVIYGDAAVKDAVIEAFKDVGISAFPLRSDQVSQGIRNATVVYIVPGGVPPRQICIKNQILSISGISSFVESGQVSVGLSVDGGKPKILINKVELDEEGHVLADEVLKMAKIVQ